MEKSNYTKDFLGEKITITKLGFDWNRNTQDEIGYYKNTFKNINNDDENNKTVNIFGIKSAQEDEYTVVSVLSERILIKSNAICFVTEVSAKEALSEFGRFKSRGLSGLTLSMEQLQEYDIPVFNDIVDSVTINLGDVSKTFLVK